MAKTGTETVVRLRQEGPPARHGQRSPEARALILGCTRIPRTSTEDTDRADTVVVGETLVCPPGTDLVATDRVEAEGVVYEIEGEPGHYRTRRGKEKAVIAAIVRVTG